ncbi:MAG TPA: ABC transporter permease [Fibrobacteres bacterium]|nr:ABC transporter permease [Fibrobacterota bacterium]
MRVLIAPLEELGEISALFWGLVRRFPLAFKNPDLLIQQMMRMGVSSLPLVLVISVFIGAVTAIQAHYQFRSLVPDIYLGTAVCKFVIVESGPVLTALVLAGRVGSAIAAEVGSMKEKEELDAMAVLDLDPLRYLALPRVLGGLLAFPLLVVVSDCVAMLGGWAISRWNFHLTSAGYIHGTRFLFDPYDLWVGLIKSFCFGLVICFMGYYHGMRAGAGARGVGQATMRSVVSSCVLILVLDFFIVYTAY